jgi:RND superfamily putative drug exporter
MTTHAPRRHDGALAGLVRTCASRPWRTFAISGAVVGAVLLAAVSVGAPFSSGGLAIPGSDAQRASDLLEERFPVKAGESVLVVFSAPRGLAAPGARAAVVRTLAAAAELPRTAEVGDPFAGIEGGLSADGTIGFARVRLDQRGRDVSRADVDLLHDTVRGAAAGSPVTVELTGPLVRDTARTGSSEVLGMAAALVALLVVFGTIVAALLPICLALVAVGTSLALLTLVASLTTMNDVSLIVVTVLGLTLAVGFALGLVTRFRRSLQGGHDPVEAATIAGATSGRTVLVAGSTAAAAVAGLVVIGLDVVTKLALGAAITVVVCAALAVTLLPAVLAALGPRVNRVKTPFTGRRDDSGEAAESTFAARWGRRVTRSPGSFAAGALAVLVAFAIPAVTLLELGASDEGTAPRSTTMRRGYDLVAEGFGAGVNGPLLVVVDLRGDARALGPLRRALAGAPGVADVARPALNEGGDTALLSVYSESPPRSREARDLVERLRAIDVPAALAGSNAIAYVGGVAATSVDAADRIGERLPLFVLVVVGITLLLLTTAFRSPTLALLFSLTTILSVLAATGVVVLVLQEGIAIGALGLDRTGPVGPLVPVIVLAIVLPLSTSSMVFLGSSIREQHVRGAQPRLAVRRGVTTAGPVIAAAAVVLTLLFLAFALDAARATKELGLALAAAVLFDAFVVRLTLLPALLWLLGDRVWSIPAWLDRLLPRLTVESPLDAEAACGERPATVSA